MRVNPNIVIQLNTTEEVAKDRYSKKKIDTSHGKEYNTGINLVSVETKNRMVPANPHSDIFIKNGFALWKENVHLFEDYFGEKIKEIDVSTKKPDTVTQNIWEIVLLQHMQQGAQKWSFHQVY